MKGRVDECMAWGALSGMTGLFLYADALGGGRAYGYTSGSIIEFVFGTLFVVAGTLLLHIAGVYRDRQFRADEEREILKKVEDYRAGRLETYGLDEVKQHLGLDD